MWLGGVRQKDRCQAKGGSKDPCDICSVRLLAKGQGIQSSGGSKATAAVATGAVALWFMAGAGDKVRDPQLLLTSRPCLSGT